MIAIRDGEHQLLTDMNMELDSRNNVAHSILHREEGQCRLQLPDRCLQSPERL